MFILIKKYDNLKEDVGYWKCIRKQMKSFILIQYKVINTQKRKANDNYYKISIDEYNEAHANDILCSYCDELNLKLELDNLTPDEKNIFLMKIEGFTFDDISEIFFSTNGSSISTIVLKISYVSNEIRL